MESRKIIWILILSIMGLSLYRCKTEEIILHGEITGLVIDAETGNPLQAAIVRLIPAYDSTKTGNDGKYIFKGLAPGNYEIKSSKNGYSENTKPATVTSANITDVDFTLDSLPVISYKPLTLDFGFYLTSLPFTISKTGPGKVVYIVTPSQTWITANPYSGDMVKETDTINIKINRTGLTQTFINEWIIITSIYRQYIFRDTINVNIKVHNEIIFNPDLSYGTVTDVDGNVYKTIAIGSQVWMAENLRTTKYKDNTPIPLVEDNVAWKNLTTPGYCWYNNDEETYKDIYGALYNWFTVGTGKLCPAGWHVPSNMELLTLITYLGGYDVAGGKMIETGTTHWKAPNVEASNSSGFTALPNGFRTTSGFFSVGTGSGFWWTSFLTTYLNDPLDLYLYDNPASIGFLDNSGQAFGYSIRCIKDLPGK